MGFRFRKRFNLIPGVKVNISKKGFSSVSVGRPGMTYNIPLQGNRKNRLTVGVPGTGMSYQTNFPKKPQGKTKPSIPKTRNSLTDALKHTKKSIAQNAKEQQRQVDYLLRQLAPGNAPKKFKPTLSATPALTPQHPNKNAWLITIAVVLGLSIPIAFLHQLRPIRRKPEVMPTPAPSVEPERRAPVVAPAAPPPVYVEPQVKPDSIMGANEIYEQIAREERIAEMQRQIHQIERDSEQANIEHKQRIEEIRQTYKEQEKIFLEERNREVNAHIQCSAARYQMITQGGPQ